MKVKFAATTASLVLLAATAQAGTKWIAGGAPMSGSDSATFGESDDPGYVAMDKIAVKPQAMSDDEIWMIVAVTIGAVVLALNRRGPAFAR